MRHRGGEEEDQAFEAYAREMARWFRLPGGGTASFANLMRTHRAWFDQARRRSMDWEDIRRYLRDIGIKTEAGEAFPLSTLTAANTRYRADVRSGKRLAAKKSPDNLLPVLDAASGTRKSARAPIAKPPASKLHRPPRGKAISRTAEPSGRGDIDVDRIETSSSVAVSSGSPAALLAAMKRSARLRDRGGSDEL